MVDPRFKPKTFWGSCLGRVLSFFIMLFMLAAIIVVVFLVKPFSDQNMLFGVKPHISDRISLIFEDRSIEGVAVVAVPLRGNIRHSIFLDLDPALGFVGLDSNGGYMNVFLELMKEISRVNDEDNLEIRFVNLEYIGLEDLSVYSITMEMSDLNELDSGELSDIEFLVRIHVDPLPTLIYFNPLKLFEQ